ncbi:MAG TPA: YbbR-like domain-containing protein [Gemmatimonadales bacterium]|nr:YbbR-like domain-containing protein [Gemmatimonadales bacterium]
MTRPRLTTKIRGWFLNNWPVKLTALVLSAVLWAAVAAEEPTTQIVPVHLVVEAPPGRALRGSPPAVQAVYVGATRELIKLYSSPPTIRRVLPDTLSGNEYTLVLSPEDLVVRRNVNVRAQDVQPRMLTILLDDVARRLVPVAPRVSVLTDSGYSVVGGIGVEPPLVTVMGPESAIRLLDTIRTVSIELTNVTDPVRRTVDLDTAGLGPVRVTPTEVRISADVAFMAERVLMGVPVLIQADRSQGLVSDPPAVIVTVRGSSLRLARLTRDSVTVVAAPATTGDRPEVVRLQVIPPNGVTGVAMPDTAIVVRRRG